METYGKTEMEDYPFEFQTFLYNAACAYSLDGNIEKSLIAYKLAVEFGWDDFDHTAQDSDLENLRDSDGYQQYQDTLGKMASAKAAEWAASELASGSSFVFDVDPCFFTYILSLFYVNFDAQRLSGALERFILCFFEMDRSR